MGLSNRIPGDLQACGLERSSGFPSCCIAVLPACEPCEFTRARCFREPADWKSAIQQVGKPALLYLRLRRCAQRAERLRGAGFWFSVTTPANGIWDAPYVVVPRENSGRLAAEGSGKPAGGAGGSCASGAHDPPAPPAGLP